MKTLLDILKKRGKWILSYNDSDTIKDWYDEFQIVPLEWAYGMKNVGKRNAKKKKMGKSQEILILSNDIQIKKSL